MLAALPAVPFSDRGQICAMLDEGKRTPEFLIWFGHREEFFGRSRWNKPALNSGRPALRGLWSSVLMLSFHTLSLWPVRWPRCTKASNAATGMILRRPTFWLGSSWRNTRVATVRADNPSRRAASTIPTASTVSSRCVLIPPLIALACDYC